MSYCVVAQCLIIQYVAISMKLIHKYCFSLSFQLFNLII